MEICRENQNYHVKQAQTADILINSGKTFVRGKGALAGMACTTFIIACHPLTEEQAAQSENGTTGSKVHRLECVEQRERRMQERLQVQGDSIVNDVPAMGVFVPEVN
jgi:hypothetical protein